MSYRIIISMEICCIFSWLKKRSRIKRKYLMIGNVLFSSCLRDFVAKFMNNPGLMIKKNDGIL